MERSGFLSFETRLKELRTQKDLSQKALADLLFVSQQTVAKWETAKSTPNPDTLAKLSEIFDVPVGYLIGADQLKTEPSSKSSPILNELVDLCSSLSDDELHEVLNYVGYVKSERNK